MGLRLTVVKEDNMMYHDFVDAYWKIENIVFSHADGTAYVTFDLNTYPSREASKMLLVPNIITGNIPVGGSTSIAYAPRIRHWEATFRVDQIFTGGSLPISEAEQKNLIYSFVKRYTGLQFEDVIETF